MRRSHVPFASTFAVPTTRATAPAAAASASAVRSDSSLPNVGTLLGAMTRKEPERVRSAPTTSATFSGASSPPMKGQMTMGV